MDDLISRKQAIDALMDEFKRVPTTAIRAKNRIERLPSAQFATDTNVGTKLGTNLAQLGTDCISRQAAIDAITRNRGEGDEDESWSDRCR